MGDQEKRIRTTALSKFTRNINTFNKLLDDNAPRTLVEPQYEAIQSSWNALENAHDGYLAIADIDINATGGLDYIDEPAERHSTALVRYSSYLKDEVESDKVQTKRKEADNVLLEDERRKRVAKELKEAEDIRLKEELETRFSSLKAEVDSGVEAFGREMDSFKGSLEQASDKDKRIEWGKVEAEFKLIKNKFMELVSMDSTQDVAEVKQKFVDTAEKKFLDTQKWMLSQLKDALTTSGGSSLSHSTKKEAVHLPCFQGEEKASPFLKFPVWKKQWENLITEYEEKWRSGLLWDHLDDAARSKFVGYEIDYAEAVELLNRFYGDPLKVISCVMREVMTPRNIVDGDYKGLLSYCTVVENNYNRLKSIGLEHEISNTSTMSSIVRKFPRTVGEKWNEFLSSKSVGEKGRPFPVFIEWMKSQKETWERMVASDVVKKDHVYSSSRSSGGSYYAEKSGDKGSCFGCGEVGHFRRDCPKNGDRSGDLNKKRHQRKKPRVKKFWCALHKGDSSKRCFSDSCQELKRLDPTERVKLLKENGDCFHCVGDHKAVDCQKQERVCGGRKDDRGCNRSHHSHELFCLQAKVFAAPQVRSMGVEDDSDGVILSIMQVKGPRKGTAANVFWDLGCTSNFVREGFAEACGFRGRKEDLAVTTLGGVVTDMTVKTYKCSLHDADGKVEYFEAYGIETITGSLSKISPSRIRKLFPHLSDHSIQQLQRGDHVDILIGIPHPSWHPERAEKAKGGGDFWIYRGKFGSCLGGRCPGIKEGTRRSNSLFSVDQSYHIACRSSDNQTYSHELEFCPKRTKLYNNQNTYNISLDGQVSFDVDSSIVVPDNPASSMCKSIVVPDSSSFSANGQVSVDVDNSIVVPDSSSFSVDGQDSFVHNSLEKVDSSIVVPDSSSFSVDGQVSFIHNSLEKVDSSIVVPDSSSFSVDGQVSFIHNSLEKVDSSIVVPDSSNFSVDGQVSFIHNSLEKVDSSIVVPDSSNFSVDGQVSSIHNSLEKVDSSIVVPGSHVVDGSSTSDCDQQERVSKVIEESKVLGLSATAPEFFPTQTSGVCSSDNVNVAESKSAVVREGFVVEEGNTVTYYGIKTAVLYDENLFFNSQSLGTLVEPRCGGCKCSRCPVPGSKYSFKEQQEFDVINKNLYHIEGENRWFTEYPWRCPRSVLPRNERTAFQNLLSLERVLSKDLDLANDFGEQIEEMVKRGAAIVLSDEELAAWDGDYYYLPMVGVKGKKKWLRVCFDASRRQRGFPCLNDCLLKGPDRFLNNLLSVIIGFRNGRVGAAADISKFHNQVHLSEKDIHMQRFLWRNMKKDAVPLTYAVTVNNFGVKPANCIATCALHRSADHFAEKYPTESREMKDQTYIDDQLVAAANRLLASVKTDHLDEIAEHAGMPNKGWVFSGDVGSNFSIGSDSSDTEEKVLGLSWMPSSDMFTFRVVLRFTVEKNMVVVTNEEEFVRALSSIKLTRRVLLANVARIFDPIGFLCPIILQSKLLMRESWCGSVAGWDDVLPEDQTKRWNVFLMSLLELKDVEFARSLWPEEEVLGLPILVVFSDGSALAFGAVAYIRWKLKAGGYWARLIMAKCKVAPKEIKSIPQMELNGGLVGNRIEVFLVKETNLEFEKVYHLVDSSTVLGYVHKECGKFRLYEGIRIAEIQSSGKFENGRLVGWAWVPGDLNPADWCTKPRQVKDLLSSFWLNGPDFLLEDEASWPIKYSYKKDDLEGELKIPKSVFAVHTDPCSDIIHRLLNRYSSWSKTVRVFARMLRLCKKSSEHVELSAEEVKEAKRRLIKEVQKSMVKELEEACQKGKGRYRKLAPVVDDEGVRRVGSRLKNFVPFTFDSKLPILLPPDHRITLLIMQEAHQFSHSGQDGTLSRFRALGFWTVRGGHLAKRVKDACVPCRKNDPGSRLNQPMGEFPPEMLKDPVAWGCCQMDLFGPFHCRGDVNPRTTKKTWAMVLEDVNSGAVHLDIVQDYSAGAVLLSMRRFGSLRGWPGAIHSDPGSQLESASGKLESWWKDMENSMRELGSSKNFEWKVSPPDSPWRQGKAERRIAIVKRLIKLSIGDSRLTPVELQTILFEIASICNERPIGLSKPREDGTYDVITPNHLLLGRSGCILPDDAEISSSLPMVARYRLIHHVTEAFWKKWSVTVSPNLVVRQKWHTKSRNLRVGDLVAIHDSSPIKAKCKLAVVNYVYPSADGCVRSVTVRYVIVKKNLRGKDKVQEIYVKRSVQRLSLILPVEEQLSPLGVEDHELCSIVKAGV